MTIANYNKIIAEKVIPILKKDDNVIVRLKMAYNVLLKAFEKEELWDEKGKINRQINIGNHSMECCMSQIVSVIEMYLCGDFDDAEALFAKNLPKIESFPTINLQKNNILYRLRKLPKGKSRLVDKIDFYPLPFSMRHKSKAHRFGSQGFTSLYLFRCISTGWEQYNRPSTNELYYAEFKLNQDIKLYDLRLLREEGGLLTDDFLLLLPILIACYLSTDGAEECFKSEYIIPQMLYQSIIVELKKDKQSEVNADKQIIGIVRNSTKVSLRNLRNNDSRFGNVNQADYFSLPLILSANDECSGWSLQARNIDYHKDFVGKYFEVSTPECCESHNLCRLG